MIPSSTSLKFSTERLSARTLAQSDYKFIFKLVNSAGWLKFIGDRNVNSEEDAVPYIQKIQKTPNLTYWVVTITETNEAIGIISLIKRAYLDHFDIGFAFLPEFMGKGFAFEATHALFSELIKTPDFQTLLAVTVPGNAASIRLLKKLGMRLDKEIETGMEKLHVYST